MVRLKYIGEERTYTDVITNYTVDLIPDTYYDLEIKYDGPITIVNGKVSFDANYTFWMIFNDGKVSIPYSPEAALNFWRLD